VTRPIGQNPVNDAVVVAAAAAEQAPSVMALADDLLKSGGICLFVFDVTLGERIGDAIDFELLNSGVFAEPLREHTSWRMCGPLETTLSAATIDMAKLGEHRLIDTAVHFDEDGILRASCIVAWEKTGVTTAEQWKRYREIFLTQRSTLVRA